MKNPSIANTTGVDAVPSTPGQLGAGKRHPLRAGVCLGLALVVLSVVFICTYLVFVTTGSGQYADERALVAALHYTRGGSIPAPLESVLDVLPAAVGAACAIGVLLCMLIRWTLLGPLVAVAGGLAAIAATQVLKHGVLDRPRLGISEANVVSFPSGHTTVAAAGVMALLLSLGPALRPVWGTIGAVVAGAAGLSTVALGWHRPSDVVGALLLVAFFGVLAASGVSLLEARRDRRAAARASSLQAHLDSPFGPGITRPAGTGACVSMSVLGLAATVVATVMIRPLDEVPAGPRLRPNSEWTSIQDPVSALLWGLVAVLGVALTLFPLLGVWASRWARPSAR